MSAHDPIGARLFDDAKAGRYSEAIEVTRADARKLVDEHSEQRGMISALETEVQRLTALLRADAAWRSRADDEPVRSMVAALLGATNRQELRPLETPSDLASSVARRCTDLEFELASERARQFRVVATAGVPGIAVVDVRSTGAEATADP